MLLRVIFYLDLELYPLQFFLFLHPFPFLRASKSKFAVSPTIWSLLDDTSFVSTETVLAFMKHCKNDKF